MNLLFRIFLAISWFNGFFPVTWPFGHFKSFKFQYFHPIILVYLFSAIFPAVLTIDQLSTNASEIQELKSQALSINFYTTEMARYVVNFTFRIASILHCKELIELVQFLVENKTFSRGNIKSYTINYLAILGISTFAATALLVYTLWLIPQNNNNANRIFSILPQSQSVISLATIVSKWHTYLSPWLGLCSIVIIGLYLLELHEDICTELCLKFYDEASVKFKLSLENQLLFKYSPGDDHEKPFWFDRFLSSGNEMKVKQFEKEDVFFVTGRSSSLNKELDFGDLSERFKKLKFCFNKYGEVAGIYALMILVSSSATIVDSVGGLAFKLGYSEERFRSVFGAVFLLLFVAHFGDFMCSKIEENRDELRNAVGHFGYKGESKLEKISNWVIDWNWKLTAKNLFVLNHGVVPANFGTIMTYFIFIFQLRMSEMDSQPSGNASKPSQPP